MNKARKVWDILRDYIIISLIVAVGLVIVMQLWNSNLATYPLQYGTGDDMTAAMTVKCMDENGWLYTNPLLGAPAIAGTNSYDATTGEFLLNLIQWFFVVITGNWVLSLNLFYLFGFFLTAFTALFVLKKLKISRFVAIAGASIYSFLPYHFLRGMGHLYLSEYFMVPIMVYFVLKLMNGELIWKKENGKRITRNNILSVIVFACMGITGIYYAYFTCFFLCVCILYKIVNRIDWKKCWQELVGIGIILVSLIATMIPSFLYWMQNGSNSAAIERNQIGSEIYSLKLVQLLLPIPGHRLGKLAALRAAYDTYPLTNENAKSSLGILMALGFLILLLSVILLKKRRENQLLDHLMVLNYTALMIGMVGSFSTIIGLFFSMIRCYNRISVFIAMFAIITVCILFDQIREWALQKKYGKYFVSIGLLCLLCFGIWDQTSTAFIPNYEGIQSEFESDEYFVKQIEEMEPNGMVFQMPYVVYPEQGLVNQMIDYSHLRGYLHSSSLKWSYCAVKGRETDTWQKEMSQRTIPEQITQLREKNFTGIYIDTYAYTQEELAQLQQELGMQLGEATIRSQDGRFLYYKIVE